MRSCGHFDLCYVYTCVSVCKAVFDLQLFAVFLTEKENPQIMVQGVT